MHRKLTLHRLALALSRCRETALVQTRRLDRALHHHGISTLRLSGALSLTVVSIALGISGPASPQLRFLTGDLLAARIGANAASSVADATRHSLVTTRTVVDGKAVDTPLYAIAEQTVRIDGLGVAYVRTAEDLLTFAAQRRAERGGTSLHAAAATNALRGDLAALLAGVSAGHDGQVLMIQNGQILWAWPSVRTGAGRSPTIERSTGSARSFGGGQPDPAPAVTLTSPIDMNSSLLTGVLSAQKGGTGNAHYEKGDLLVGNSIGTLDRLAVGSGGQFLVVGTGGTVYWGSSSSGAFFHAEQSLTSSGTLAVRGDTFLQGRVGIGTSTLSGTLNITQESNGQTMIVAHRATDTVPSGDFINFKNAADDTTLFRVDNSGNITSAGIINNGALTVTATTGPQLRVQYDGSNEWTSSTTSVGKTTFGFNGTKPQAIFTPQLNATGSFLFTAADGTSVLTVDTTNRRIGIGVQPKTALEVNGTMSGSSLTVSTLTSCEALKTSSAGALSCATALTQSSLDARYVNTSGDTMTGALALVPSGGSGATALRIVGQQTLTGSMILQASAAGVKPLIVKGAVGQTANLQEWQNSAGAVLASLDSNANFVLNKQAADANGLVMKVLGTTTLTINNYDAGAGASILFSSVGTASLGNTSGVMKLLGTSIRVTDSGGSNTYVSMDGTTQRVAVAHGAVVTPNSILDVRPSAAEKGLIVQGAASQTANLLELQNSASTVLASFSNSGALSLISSSVNEKPLIIKAAASQSANLTEWQNSAGTAQVIVGPEGQILVGSVSSFDSRFPFRVSSLFSGTVNIGADFSPFFHTTATGNAQVINVGPMVRYNSGISSVTGLSVQDVVPSGGYPSGVPYYGIKVEDLVTAGTSYSIYTGIGLVKLGDTTTIVPSVAGNKGLIVKGAASQTANLLELQNSAATVLASFSQSGALTINPSSGGTSLALNVRGTMSGRSLFVSGTGSSPLLLVQQSTGRVGIGTTSPTTTLSVYAPSSNGIKIEAAAGAQLQLWTDQNVYVPTNRNWAISANHNANGDLSILHSSSYNSSPNGATVMQFKSDNSANFWGNVGIGTTAPGSKLSVSGSVIIGNNVGSTAAKAGLSLEVNGTMSGSSLAISNLNSCEALKTSSAGALSCATALTQSSLDARYVNTSGDTMTGALVLTPSGGSGSLALRIVGRQTLTGSMILQASAAGVKPLIVKGAVGQTANLQEWQDSAGTALLSLTAAGALRFNDESTTYLSRNGTGLIQTNNFYVAGSNLGVYEYDTAYALTVVPSSATLKGMKIKGAASQTANLLELQNSAGTILSSFSNSGALSIVSSSENEKPLIIKAAASQSANLTEWQDSAGTALTSITSAGNLSFKNGYTQQIEWTGGNGAQITFAGSALHLQNQGVEVFNGNGGSAIANGVPSFPRGLVVVPLATNYAGLVVKGTLSQTANLFELQNSAGTILSSFSSSGALSLISSSVNEKPLIIKGAASQSANLTEWQSSAGQVNAKIANNGAATFGYSSVGAVQNAGVEVYSQYAAGLYIATAANPYYGLSVSTDTSYATIQSVNTSLKFAAANSFSLTTAAPYTASPISFTDVSGGLSGVNGNTVFTNLTATWAPTSTASDFAILKLTGTINETGTATGNYTGLLINAIETAVLGTANKLIDLQVNSASVFSVSSKGAGILNISSPSATGLVIKGFASQTANLQEWQNSAGTVLTSLSATGSLTTSGTVLLRSNETGAAKDMFKIVTNVASASDPVFRVTADGHTYADNAYSAAGADYAEWFQTSPRDGASSGRSLEPGELVCIDPTQSNAVQRCSRDADANVMGIVSTNPGFVGNTITGADGITPPGYALVGLIGQVPAKVIVQSGAVIQPGDQLTAASTPGYARKANPGESTVGVALEPFAGAEGATGTIQVLISRRNQSLTGEMVQQRVLDSIAAMKIDDAISQKLQQQLSTLDLSGKVQTLVAQQIQQLNLAGTMHDVIMAHVNSGSLVTGWALRQTDAQLRALIDQNRNAGLTLAGVHEYLTAQYGVTNATGSLILGRNTSVNGTLTVSGLLSSSGGLVIKGSVQFQDLLNCPSIKTDEHGTLMCGTAIGLSQQASDARYLQQSGGTLTGALVINPGSGTGTALTVQIGAGRAGIQIRSGETNGSQDMFKIVTDVNKPDNTVFRVTATGAVYTNSTFNSAGADYAEWFQTSPRQGGASSDRSLEPGELVCIDVTRPNTVKRCEREADVNLMGIVSTHPAFIGNTIGGAGASLGITPPGYALVGLIGQVPAKVMVESGAVIHPGDSLTAASTPGYARKARAGESTVGVALEPLESGAGVINVLISRRNQSLTVEAMEDHVFETIKDMAIEDEVQTMITDSLNKITAAGAVTDAVSKQLETLKVTEQFTKILSDLENLKKQVATVATADQRPTATGSTSLHLPSLSVQGTATLSGAVTTGDLTARSIDTESTLSVGQDARIGGDLYLEGQLKAANLYVANGLQIDGSLDVHGALHAAAADLGSGSVLHGLTTLDGDLSFGSGAIRMGSGSAIIMGSGSSIRVETLIVRDALQVLGNITISGLAQFLGDVDVRGTLTVSSRQAGYALVKKGEKSVTVRFGTGYTVTPVVTASPDIPVLYAVSKATATGFTIRIADAASEDITFSWLALGTVEVQTATNEDPAQIQSDAVVSSVSSAPAESSLSSESSVSSPEESSSDSSSVSSESSTSSASADSSVSSDSSADASSSSVSVEPLAVQPVAGPMEEGQASVMQ